MSDIQILSMTEEDLPVLIDWARDEKTLIEWCGPVFDYPLTIEQLNEYFAESTKPNPQRFIFKAVTGGKMCGMAELGAVYIKNETGALCRIFVDKQYRGKGIAEYMISKVLDFGFNELNLIRIDLNVYSYNTPAIKCYEKLGFIREGIRRKSTKYQNEYWDSCFYALLKDEWA